MSKSVLDPFGRLIVPSRCEGCPHRGRAWCLDEDGYPACDREDVNGEDEDIHGFIPEGLFDGSEDEEDEE